MAFAALLRKVSAAANNLVGLTHSNNSQQALPLAGLTTAFVVVPTRSAFAEEPTEAEKTVVGVGS
jgi:hypothetical protein